MHIVPEPTTHPDNRLDPITMRRRTLIAAALGLPAAGLPQWAAHAAETPDGDHTLTTYSNAFDSAQQELHALGARYVTQAGVSERGSIKETGVWLFGQTYELSRKAPPGQQRQARRLAAEAAMFAAGCWIDYGDNRAASDLYSRAHLLCGEHDRDLRAFIGAQYDWVPMYSGRWHEVQRQSHNVIKEAEAHGGYGLLMGWTHLAKAQAILGDKFGARESLARAQSNIARVPGATAAPTALAYSATKAWFASSLTYAELGDVDQYADARHRAASDPDIGWIDSQLMRLGKAQLDPDPEHAARTIRLQVAQLPHDDFNHCIRAEALRINGKLKARQIIGGRDRKAGPEVRMLGSYLSQVKVA